MSSAAEYYSPLLGHVMIKFYASSFISQPRWWWSLVALAAFAIVINNGHYSDFFVARFILVLFTEKTDTVSGHVSR